MKTKYVLFDQYERNYIFDSRADVEEFILSETEDRMYYQACLNSTSPEAWLNYQRKRWVNIWGGDRYKTFEGFLYDSWYDHYKCIREAFAFED